MTKKSPSDLLKEKLIDIKPDSEAKKKFNKSTFESEAKKVKETFAEKQPSPLDGYIQPRESFGL